MLPVKASVWNAFGLSATSGFPVVQEVVLERHYGPASLPGVTEDVALS